MDIFEEQLAAEAKTEENEKRVIRDKLAFKSVASTINGRNLIRRVLNECGVYRSTFTGDPITSAFNEGKRSVGLMILAEYDDYPDLYITLISEKDDGK